jgi:hypothetical protein
MNSTIIVQKLDKDIAELQFLQNINPLKLYKI